MTVSQPNPLTNRIAVVTGASSGIGRATALDLLAAGAKVVINARRADALTAIQNETGTNPNLAVHAGDASDPNVIEQLLATAEKTFGPLDIAIVNAGRGLSGSLLTSDTSQWNDMIATNLLGAMHFMRAAAQRMVKRRETAPGIEPPLDIIVLGSTVGRHISPFSAAYGTTKFAIGSAAEALRRELAPKGIRVTLIEPGIVRSGFQKVAGYSNQWFDEFSAKIGPVLEPQDIARVISFVIAQPPHVHINDLMIRPTRQDYP